MNNRDPKTIAIKLLAIFGFFVLIGSLSWLLIRGVQYAPKVFSSLASIAENLERYRGAPELTIATEKSIVNAGESMSISWTDMRQRGTYTFGYSCTDGVSIAVRGESGELVNIQCNETLSLPADVHGLFISISSERGRFIDVPLQLSFKNESGEVVTSTITQVTVVNAVIPFADRVRGESIESGEDENESRAAEVPEPEESRAELQESSETAVVAPAPAATPSLPKYMVPVSDPTGIIDLKVSFIGMGTLMGETFIPTDAYNPSARNALRFEVMNVGTKTSNTWSLLAALPGDVEYKAGDEAPLLPNERALYTLGFNLEPSASDIEIVRVAISEPEDLNIANDTFSWTVQVAN